MIAANVGHPLYLGPCRSLEAVPLKNAIVVFISVSARGVCTPRHRTMGLRCLPDAATLSPCQELQTGRCAVLTWIVLYLKSRAKRRSVNAH